MEVVISRDSKDLLKSSADEIFGKNSKEAVVSEHSKVPLKSSDDEIFGKNSKEAVVSEHSKVPLKSSDDEVFGKKSMEAVTSGNSEVLLKSSDDEMLGKKNVEAVMSGNSLVLLKSSDDQLFDVDKLVAIESAFVKHIIEDTVCEARIPLPNVNSKTLAKVMEYCEYHVKARNGKPTVPEDEIKQWDAKFVNVDQATLFDLILAANYLNIANLLDLTCQCVADMIKGKTPEEIRSLFNITNDFTPEEEAQVRKENLWAFE